MTSKRENQTRIEKYMMLVEKGYVLYYTHQCPINAKYVPVVEESAAKNGIPFKAILLGNKEEARNAPTPVGISHVASVLRFSPQYIFFT